MHRAREPMKRCSTSLNQGNASISTVMAKSNKTDSVKSYGGCDSTGTVTHCLKVPEMLQLL